MNGVYEISISGFQKADVYCDMKTKDGGMSYTICLSNPVSSKFEIGETGTL